MARITKYRCDHCAKEVEDTYLEPGWINIDGTMTRSWGIRSKGQSGDGLTDYLKGMEFCGVECLVAELDAERRKKRGPEPHEKTKVAEKKPWEDPLPDDHTSEEKGE